MGQPFVVQMANRPGELAHLSRALGMRGINIVQIAGSGAGDMACALLTTDDDRATAEVLHSMGVQFVTGATLIVEVPDEPGALGAVTAKLAAADVDVKGFCIIGRRAGSAEVALAIDDETRAREVLGLPAVLHLVAAAG